MYAFKLSNPHHQNLRVIFYWYTCKYHWKWWSKSKTTCCKKKNEFSPFFFSSSTRLAQHSLNVLPWLTHKPAPFCSTGPWYWQASTITDSVNGTRPHPIPRFWDLYYTVHSTIQFACLNPPPPPSFKIVSMPLECNNVLCSLTIWILIYVWLHLVPLELNKSVPPAISLAWYYQATSFFLCNIEKLGGAWVQGYN